MLIRFIVSNFLSFNEETEFNMLAGSFKTHKNHVYNAGKVDVLKAAALYGANGAGKSNLIKAIEFLQNAVEEGAIKKSINDNKFKLNKSNESKPVSFEIEFAIDKTIYSYGISFNNNIVIEEWLYESGINIEDKLIFERKLKSGKTSITIAEKYNKTQKQKLLKELMEDGLLKQSELFLSKEKEFKIKEITAARQFITHYLVIIHPSSKYQNLIPHLASSVIFKGFANNLLKTFDTGVTELDIETIDFDRFFGEEGVSIKKELQDDLEKNDSALFSSNKGVVLIKKEKGKYIVKKIVAQHLNNEGKAIPFDISDESDGTQRLLDLIPAFDGIIKHELIFIIDEIDQSLHPALLRALVLKIMADKTTKGQFIFTTHESNLLDLDIFRQDEIWFVEKERNSNSTQLYSLSEFKPRYDLDIRKGYLKGRFGAIPFLANLVDLKWDTENAKKKRI